MRIFCIDCNFKAIFQLLKHVFVRFNAASLFTRSFSPFCYSSSNKQSGMILHRINVYESAISSQRNFYQLSPTTVISGEVELQFMVVWKKIIDITVLGILARFAFLGLFVFRVLKWVQKRCVSLRQIYAIITYVSLLLIQ